MCKLSNFFLLYKLFGVMTLFLQMSDMSLYSTTRGTVRALQNIEVVFSELYFIIFLGEASENGTSPEVIPHKVVQIVKVSP
jgi:hypothetical protein